MHMRVHACIHARTHTHMHTHTHTHTAQLGDAPVRMFEGTHTQAACAACVCMVLWQGMRLHVPLVARLLEHHNNLGRSPASNATAVLPARALPNLVLVRPKKNLLHEKKTALLAGLISIPT